MISISLNPNIKTELLNILSSDVDLRVRSNVAKNPKISVPTLMELAKDEDYEVRSSVFSNPILTKDLFYKLMHDIRRLDRSYRRLMAFLDPNVSPEILEKNANSLLWNERFAIAIHPTTPSNTVKQLAKDGNVYVRAIAQQRKNDP